MKYAISSAVALAVCAWAATPKNVEHQPERFSLVSAVVNTYGEHGGATRTYEEHALFRIDHQTGKTWLYIQGTSEKEARFMWIPIEEKQ